MDMKFEKIILENDSILKVDNIETSLVEVYKKAILHANHSEFLIIDTSGKTSSVGMGMFLNNIPMLCDIPIGHPLQHNVPAWIASVAMFFANKED